MQGEIMKKIIQVASFLALAFVFGNVDANAQAFGKRFEANVSFDFVIGNEAFPAGKYYLRVAGDPNGPAFLEVRNAERDIVFQGIMMTNGERLTNAAQLRFDQSTGRPALALILSENAGYTVPVRSKGKLIAAKEGRPQKVDN
jgi:hypothetical protein